MVACYAVRLLLAGVVLLPWTGLAESAWLPDGTPVAPASGAQYLKGAFSDGAGGLYVVWFDNSGGN